MNPVGAAAGTSRDPGREHVRLPGIWVPATGSAQPAKARGAGRATSRLRRSARQLGPSFFGWLTAVGAMGWLAGGIGVADRAEQVARSTAPSSGGVGDPGATVDVTGVLAMVAVLLVGYFCGGYVASRMSPTSGIRPGLVVWLWGTAVAVLIAVLAAVAGARYDVLASVPLPRLPVDERTLATNGIAVLLVGLLASLVGAVVGGVAGKRHDR